ncbi:hypothetical protein [Defluviitalea saccharophila]
MECVKSCPKGAVYFKQDKKVLN